MADDSALRVEKFPFGIVGAGLGEIERRVPADEPPALRPNAELSVIGKPIPRQNALGKVTGATRYTVDVALPGMLYGRILRSASPHARIRALDLSAAARHPEVRAALAIAQPGDPASGIVRYVGAPIAAIAATSIAAARDAEALIRVDTQPLPFVVDMDAAKAPGAPIVHDETSAPDGHPSGWPSPAGLPIEGNLRGPAAASRGDAAQGFTEAEVVVEGEYRTQTQTHCCLEPHAIVADWRGDGLTVYISTQFTAGVREQLAEAFGLPLENVRVIVDGMGGGFGSKSSLGNYGRIAVALSRQAGAPVRIALERGEEQIDAGNRPETWQRLRIGARRDGTLTAISLQSYGSAGVALGAGVGFFAQGLYACPNFESSQFDVFINAGPGCAMRGPGNTPGAFAMEQAIDELAERLGLDPLALRERIDPSPLRREERRLGALRIGWQRRRAAGADPGPVKRGLGVAQSLWGANVQTRSSCEVRVNRDGAIEILSGVQDIGTGVGTVMAQTVAEVFGLRPEDIVVRIGDTAFPPGPPSYGSRTTASITPPARVAAWRVLQALLREAALMLNAGAEDLVAREGRIEVRGEPSRSLGFREAAMRMSVDRISATASRSDDYGGFRRRMPDAAIAEQDLGGVQFAEVAVDTETGIVRVERVVAAQDCGRPMNPLLIESQVQGGVLMGLSYALLEERILDRPTGRMVNANLEQYKLAGPSETPAIEVVLLENYLAESATDAYGIAEPSNIATAPAIANAIYNAIGVRLRALPMTPAAVLHALGKIERRS
jgi:xanthine dehydrogenase YagR molybdenum-binding subunit